MTLFDSHAHLDDDAFAEDRDAVIQRAVAGGVERIVNIGADMESSARSVALAGAYDMIYAAVGIHPHEASRMNPADDALLFEWTKLDKVVAIGEIGLDYYYDHSPRDRQKEAFIRQLDVARQARMPVVIHNRDAHGDTMEILRREGKGLTGVVHCFSGSQEMADELVKMGWYIGVDGPVTFKNAAKLPDIVRRIPLERLLIETDCPYLTPVPLRGKRNEPAYVKYVARRVADLRDMAWEALAEATAENACRLFNIR